MVVPSPSAEKADYTVAAFQRCQNVIKLPQRCDSIAQNVSRANHSVEWRRLTADREQRSKYKKYQRMKESSVLRSFNLKLIVMVR